MKNAGLLARKYLMRYSFLMSGARAYPLLLISLVLALVTEIHLFIWVAIFLVAILIVRPALLEPVVFIFEKCTRFLGTWASNIVLGIIFFGIVVPYGYLYRRLEKKLTAYFFDPKGRQSFFVEERKRFLPADFEKSW